MISLDSRKYRHWLDLMVVLVTRDLKLLYKRSFLGFGWALGLPILQLVIYSFVFRKVLSFPIENYSAYVFIGVLLYGWFQSSLSESGGLVTASKFLVIQPSFPLILLSHVKACVRLFHLLLALPLLVAMLYYCNIRPSLPWLSLPVLIVIQYAFIVGISYPLSSLNVFYRDTQHFATVGLQLLMFLTPIFYSIDQIPEEIRLYYYLNPMVGITQCWRSVLLDSSWPDLMTVSLLGLSSIIIIFLGKKVFLLLSDRFHEEIS
jgi:lipopolysaccharide transport system permease protein